MKFSTGKGTRMKHATGLNMQRLSKLKRRVKSLKHSKGSTPARDGKVRPA